MAGFRAEAYTVPLEQVFDEARQIMDRVVERDVQFDIGGDAQEITALDTQVSDFIFKHILLPVWLATYKYHGQTYRFVVKPRTGRVQSERPWSTWKITLALLASVLLAGVAGYFYALSEGLV